MTKTLEEKIGQMMVVGFHGTEAPAYLLEWLRAGRVGGVILFQRNVESPEQVAALVESLHAAAKYPLLVSIDQEGGTVARLREGFTESPGMMALGASRDVNLAREVSAMLGREMHALGMNWNYAPVVDVTHDINNPSVGTRSVGTSPQMVGAFASVATVGFQSAGVAACAKHFPGLGNTPIDTHVALAVIDGELDYLWNNDLVPFREVVNAGVASVMLTHVKFTALNAEHPATMAREIAHDLLREEIGFTGAVTTDCMEMKAIADHYGAGESAVLAALAGVDLILFSHTPSMQEQAYSALLEAVRSGRVPMSRIDEALSQIETLKAAYPAQTHPDLSVIRSEKHLALSQMAARSGVAVLRGGHRLPVGNFAVSVVEFGMATLSEVMEQETSSAFMEDLQARLNVVKHAIVPSRTGIKDMALVDALVSAGDVVIVATRSAHLIPEQLEAAKLILKKADITILVCLRNPYDAVVLDADMVICSHGDSTPSLQAVADLLAGDFTASGRLTLEM